MMLIGSNFYQSVNTFTYYANSHGLVQKYVYGARKKFRLLEQGQTRVPDHKNKTVKSLIALAYFLNF